MKLMNTGEIVTAAEHLSHLLRELYTHKSMVESEIIDLEREHDNITHRMEKMDCKYKERARLATQLAGIRRERRKLKDWLKMNEPYFRYIDVDNGNKTRNLIDNIVGVGRRVANNQARLSPIDNTSRG